jgi:hypothetical protein
MSKPTDKLRLGPLPKVEMTKVTFACSTMLKAELERYAALHAQTYNEPVDGAALIPHMLATFMEQDQAFRRAGRPDQRHRPAHQEASVPPPVEPDR